MKLPFLKKKSKRTETIFGAQPIKIQDIIAPALVEVKQHYLKIGERFAKSFFVLSYPRYVNSGWLSPVINLNIPLDIALYIYPLKTEQVLKKLLKKLTEVQSELMERTQKGLVRDPVLETAFHDIEILRDKLQTAQERMFELGVYLTIYGKTSEQLSEIETNLRSIFETRMIYLKPALYKQREGFITTSPYFSDQIGVCTIMNTGPLSSCFPFISFDLSSQEGILYGINQHNNSLVLFDRFSLENANSCVFGTAGGGKSIKGNTSVLIKNKNKVQLTKIGPLVEKLIKKEGVTKIDEEMEGVINPEIKVYSFDKNLKGEWSRVTVAARKKATKDFYKFKTRSGREITTTGDHNMLVLKNGKIVASKSSDVKEGNFIPLPRNISETQNPQKYFNLLKLLKKAKGVYVLGGENLIKENYKILKGTPLDKRLDRYLYKYRDSRPVPIQYFWKILNALKIRVSDLKLKNLKVVSKNGKRKYTLNIHFPITPGFLRLIGYITAEGTIRNNVVMISNIDSEVLRDIDCSLKALGIPFFYGNRGIVIATRVFVEIIKALGGKNKSADKKVCSFIFNLEKEKIATYLSTYFEGDGGVEKNRVTISATSKSKRLISEISYLLYCFGIIGRISKTKKKATNSNWKRKRLYWKLSITGQGNLRKFAENINFISKTKRRKLFQIIQKEGNTNVDIVPETKEIFEEIYQLLPPLFYGIHRFPEWKRGERNPSPQSLRKAINEIEKKIQNFTNLSSTFKVLRELPELATIIDLGKSNKKLNRALWQTLGHSWQIIKNQRFKPLSRNAFKAIKVINDESYSLTEIKENIHLGFKEMGLTMKYYNPFLQRALTSCPESNTSYETIQKSAQFIWQNYQKILNEKIPQIEERVTQLKVLANSNLFWDPVVEIKKIENKKEKYVYDLTVDNEVFLAGEGGMFVHNSYAVKLELLRSLMLGVDCILIDPENEYEFLSDAVGGSYFKISLTSPNHINPFELPMPREDERAEDVLRSNIINLVGLMRIMLGGLTPEEDAIMDRALTETYALKDITPETDFSKAEPPLMEDLEAVLETMEGAESLVRRLRKFTKGTYASFFNQPSNITVDNRFVVFGIRDMEEELRPMAMYIILRYIWKIIRAQLKKRILVVDEAWWIMQTEDGASFLYGLAKRARKYWLGVTTITQDVSDFMKSDYGKPIITNSALLLLMKQSPATIDVVKKTFNLTEEEKYLLLEGAIGEGLFFAGKKHIAIRVMASYTEDQIITTSPEEVLKIKKAKREL